MLKQFKLGILLCILLVVFTISPNAFTSSLSPYVILEAENGDFVGQSLSLVNNGEMKYVSFNSGNSKDGLSQLLDIESGVPMNSGSASRGLAV